MNEIQLETEVKDSETEAASKRNTGINYCTSQFTSVLVIIVEWLL